MPTKSQLLKKDLKAALPKEKFSVTGDNHSIRVLYIDGPALGEVSAIANNYESISYCQASGEILSGGNTYVSVNRRYSEESLKYALSVVANKGGYAWKGFDINSITFEAQWDNKGFRLSNDDTHSIFVPGFERRDLAQSLNEALNALDLSDGVPAESEAEPSELDESTADEPTIAAISEPAEDTTIAPVEIEISPFFMNAKFAKLNKNDRIGDYRDECRRFAFFMKKVQVMEHWTMTAREFDIFTNSLLTDREFLKGKGGFDSTYVSSEETGIWELSDAAQALWDEGSYVKTIAVTAPNRETVVIDPQGRSYVVYLGLVTPEADRLLKQNKINREKPKPANKITKKKRVATAGLSVVQSGIEVTENKDKNGIEIRFAANPSLITQASLHKNGFRLSTSNGCWYRMSSDSAKVFAYSLQV